MSKNSNPTYFCFWFYMFLKLHQIELFIELVAYKFLNKISTVVNASINNFLA
jgi:hypothetical protein